MEQLLIRLVDLLTRLVDAAERAFPAPAQEAPEKPEPAPQPAPKPEPEPAKPQPEPAKPQPEPAKPQPEPAPPPAEQPGSLPAGYKAVQDYKIDRKLSFDWSSKTGFNIFLCKWAGGDLKNGVGGSVGTPGRVRFEEDKSATLSAAMDAGKWCMGALQLNRPKHAIGKWGIVVTSHTGSAVNAFYTHDDNGKELDFELVRRDGVIGWAPAVHMPRTGGGRASSSRRKMALGAFKLGTPQRLECELFADRCEFSIDGALFETIRHADMAAGFIWDTTTPMATFATIERHAGWAGWGAPDYARESRMTVHAFSTPAA